MTSQLDILLLEDNPGDARLVREGLQEVDALRFELIHAETLAQALVRLGERRCDVGLLDLGLADARGLEVVRRVHQAAPEMPLLVLTGIDDESLAIQALHEGAQDYLLKAEVESAALWRALRYAMERHRLQVGLRTLSLVDDLTGLSNLKGFLRLADHHAQLAYRLGKVFLVGFIDLDGMKRINDTFGHQEGNHALVEAANVLRDSLRQCDILARYGGDEFAILISDAVDVSAPTVIERIHAKVRACNAQAGRRYELSLSIGIAASDPAQPPDLQQLLDRADALMYQNKQKRRLARGLDSVTTGEQPQAP